METDEEGENSIFKEAIVNAREGLSKNYLVPVDDQLKTEFESYRTCVTYLSDLLEQALEKISYLQKANQAPPTTTETSSRNKPEKIEYETDEEELAQETEWIRIKHKKRKATRSPEDPIKWANPKGLKGNPGKSDPGNQESKIKEKNPTPPPITVTGLKEYTKIRALLSEVGDKDSKVLSLSNDRWKISVTSSDAYRSLSKKLNENNLEWFTYENKLERPIKVVARGLHHSCSDEEIVNDLKIQGFDILGAVNLIKKERKEDSEGNRIVTQHKLPLYMLTFTNKENIDKIYDIKQILNLVVRIEPLRKSSRFIPQCKRCQGYNHTKAYCQREARCVKCAGKHETEKCGLGQERPAKCVNCGDQHSANYRGCEVAKELQKLRYRSHSKNTQKPAVLKEPRAEQEKPSPKRRESKTISYSSVLKTGDPQNQAFDQMKAMLLEMFSEQKKTNKLLLDRIEKLEKSMKKPAAQKK